MLICFVSPVLILIYLDINVPEKYCLTVLYRCPNLNQIPLTCKLKYNPDDPCCPLPDCPAIIPPTAGPGSTLAPTAQPPPMPGRVPVSTIFLGEMILSNWFFLLVVDRTYNSYYRYSSSIAMSNFLYIMHILLQ